MAGKVQRTAHKSSKGKKLYAVRDKTGQFKDIQTHQRSSDANVRRKSMAAPAHIRLDERRVAWIDGTNTKVIEVALDMIAHGWSPEEIHFQHAHLSLAQIHAALGYYYDHKAEMDARIQRSAQEVERLRAQAGESPIRKRLREMGKLT